MSRTVTVVTPENIVLTYRVAGVASRFLAALTDLLVQIALWLLLAQVMQWTVGGAGGRGLTLAGLLTAVSLVLSYLILIAYPVVFEMAWGGRTPGKRLFGLRVVRDGGSPITLFASVVRNLLRFVDFGLIPLAGTALLLWGLPGLLCIFFSPAYKRLGDYAAGTLVIQEAGALPFAAPRAGGAQAGIEAMLPCVKNISRLTPEEYRRIRRFTARRESLEIPVQASLGERLALPLIQKLEIRAPIAYQMQYAELLDAIERSYAWEHGIL